MAVTIAAESPLQDEVRALVASLNHYLRPLSPPEFQFELTVEEMAGEDMTAFIARDDAGEAIGIGALKLHDATLGEVKRMFTTPSVRNTGAGWKILREIEAKARDMGICRPVLETGSTAGFEPAWALYERSGFRRCAPVLDYPDSAYSCFYEKTLDR